MFLYLSLTSVAQKPRTIRELFALPAILGEKPRHPERSEGSPESGSVPYLEDLHYVLDDVIYIIFQ